MGTSQAQSNVVVVPLQGDDVTTAGIDWVGGSLVHELFAVDTVRSVTLSAPSSGYAQVIASGTFTSNADREAQCSISVNSVAIDVGHRTILQTTSDGIQNVSFSLVRGAQVPIGDSVFRLICERTVGLGAAAITDAAISVIFVPRRY